jgi:hypothetical protein
LAVVEVIVNSGAQIDARSGSDGATPLLRACEGGNPTIVKCLLDKGADRAATTRDGRNACHVAAQFKWPGLVEVGGWRGGGYRAREPIHLRPGPTAQEKGSENARLSPPFSLISEW